MVRPGRTADESGSMILNFMKFTDKISGAPSEKQIIVINARRNERADECFKSIVDETVTELIQRRSRQHT